MMLIDVLQNRSTLVNYTLKCMHEFQLTYIRILYEVNTCIARYLFGLELEG